MNSKNWNDYLEAIHASKPLWNRSVTLEEVIQRAAQTQPIFRNRESLLRHVVQRAKSLGTWIERIEDGNLHCVDAVVNNAGYKMEAANKVSVKRPGRRSCT